MCWCVPSPHPITQNRVSSLSFLVNLSLSSFRVCLSLLPPLWLVGLLLPGPSLAPCSLWLGRSGGAWSRVMAKFFQSAKFFRSLHISLSLFHKSSCCHHLALLPDHGMPPCDLLPPSAALYGEATWYEFLPPTSLPHPSSTCSFIGVN